MSSLFEEILRKFHVAFLITVPPDYTESVFRRHLNFLLSISFRVLTIRSRMERNLPLICTLAMYLSGSRRLLRDNLRAGTLSTTDRKTLLFFSNIRLVSLLKFSKYFGFNSNFCCCRLSSKLSYFSKKHR